MDQPRHSDNEVDSDSDGDEYFEPVLLTLPAARGISTTSDIATPVEANNDAEVVPLPTFNFQELHVRFRPPGASMWALPPLPPSPRSLIRRSLVAPPSKPVQHHDGAFLSEAAVMSSSSSLSSEAAQNVRIELTNGSTENSMAKRAHHADSSKLPDDLKAAQDQAARTTPDRLVGRRLCVQGLGFVRVLAFHRISRQARMQSARGRAHSSDSSRRSSLAAMMASEDSLHTLQTEAQSDANDMRASLEMLRSRPIECVLRRRKQGTWNSGLPFVFADDVAPDNDVARGERGSGSESDSHEEVGAHDNQSSAYTNPIATLQFQSGAQHLPPPPPPSDYIHPLHKSATSSEVTGIKTQRGVEGIAVVNSGGIRSGISNTIADYSSSGKNSGNLSSSSNSAGSARNDLPGWCHGYDVAKAGWLRLERADASNAADSPSSSSTGINTFSKWILSRGGTTSVLRYFTMVVPPPANSLSGVDNSSTTGISSSGISHGGARVDVTQPRLMYSNARDKAPKLDAQHCIHLAVESVDSYNAASPPDSTDASALSLVLPDPNDTRRFTVGKWGLVAANDNEAAGWIRALHVATTQHRVNRGRGGSAVDSWFVGGLSSRSSASEDTIGDTDGFLSDPRSRASTISKPMQRYRSLSSAVSPSEINKS